MLFVRRRKLIWILIILILILFANFRYYRWDDISYGCHIKIKHSLLEWSNRNIKEALKALRLAMPEEYEKVCEHTKIISPNLGCGGFRGGCFYGNEPETIYISTSNDDFLGWTAAIILHENCHLMQMKEGREMSESECYQLDHKALKEMVVYE